jgi:hypothetical protein
MELTVWVFTVAVVLLGIPHHPILARVARQAG